MQKKFPYSVLKWTLMLGVASSLATACVVTSGDGSGLGDGGDGNNNTGDVGNEAGETSSGGSSAGKGGSGGSGGSATAGSSTGGTASGGQAGGTAYVPGQCMADLPTPASEPSCDDAKTNEDPCRLCLRTKACSLWKECYGTNPTTACGYGPVEGDGGQFGCILKCFYDNTTDEADPDKLFASCGGQCALQCEAADTAITDVTNDLAGEAYDKCNTECFLFK